MRTIAHIADLHTVVPLAATLQTTIQFENQPVVLNLDLRDLDLFAHARGRTHRLTGLFPLLFVVLSGSFKFEGLLGARQHAFGSSKLSGQATQDLGSLFERQLLCAKSGDKQQRNEETEFQHLTLLLWTRQKSSVLLHHRCPPEK